MLDELKCEELRVALEAEGFRWADIRSMIAALPATLESIGLDVVERDRKPGEVLEPVRCTSRPIEGRPGMMLRSVVVDGQRYSWLDEVDPLTKRYKCAGVVGVAGKGGEV